MFVMKSNSRVTEVRETMATFKRSIAAGVMVLVGCGVAAAQTPAEVEQIRMRQQLATMEGVLQQAVVSGAQNVIAQVRSIIRDSPRLGTPRASGVRLDGYGMVFYVQVPEFTIPILYDVLLREMQDRNASMILQQWNLSSEILSNVVDVYVSYLRSKIDARFGSEIIKTVRGRGYMLVGHEDRQDNPPAVSPSRVAPRKTIS